MYVDKCVKLLAEHCMVLAHTTMYVGPTILLAPGGSGGGQVKRGSRGGGGSGPPPPWDLSEVGSCVEAWWEHMLERGSNGCLSFFFDSPVLNVLHIYILSSSIFRMERSSFLYITLVLMKRIQLTIPCFHERASSYFPCLKLHDFTPFKTKIFWGRTPWPPSPTHLQYKTTMPSLCLCREGLAIVQKTMSYRKKTLYVDYGLESRLRLRRRRTTTTLRCFFRFLPPPPFFFASLKFRKVWPPLTKIPGSAPASG